MNEFPTDRAIPPLRERLTRSSYGYERIVVGHTDAATVAAHARSALERGRVHGHGVTLELSGDNDWSGTGLHRSALFHLQSWDPLEVLLVAFDQTRDREVLDRLCDVVGSWIAWCEAGGTAATGQGEDFVWYDMAVGMRCYRLAYLLTAVADASRVSDATFAAWLRSLDRHVAYLADDANFRAHNNHGVYQAAAQIATGRRLSGLAGMDDVRAHGEGRLQILVERQFSPDGVHLEHSPAYHDMVSRIFAGLLASDLVEDERLVHLMRGASEASEWMRTPAGSLVNFGDTDVKHASDRNGAAPGAETGERCYPQAGYWFVRPASPPGAYLAQTCAMHSRSHKHCDDASFVWYEGGEPLLIDGGRFGYLGRTAPDSPLFQRGFWYADRRRVHVERARAHNTIEIDGVDWNRKRRPAYGSGMVRSSAVDGVFASSTQTSNVHAPVEHERVLVYRPGRWVLCLDHLRDPTGAPHTFRQWFNVAPAFVPSDAPDAHALRFVAGGGEGSMLEIRTLYPAATFEPVRCGYDEPGEDADGYPLLAGWHATAAESFEPNAAVALVRRDRPDTTFATLIAREPLQPLPASEHEPSDATERRFAWRGRDGLVEVVTIQTSSPSEPLARVVTSSEADRWPRWLRFLRRDPTRGRRR